MGSTSIIIDGDLVTQTKESKRTENQIYEIILSINHGHATSLSFFHPGTMRPFHKNYQSSLHKNQKRKKIQPQQPIHGGYHWLLRFESMAVYKHCLTESSIIELVDWLILGLKTFLHTPAGHSGHGSHIFYIYIIIQP